VTNVIRVENEKKSGPQRGATFTPSQVPQAPGAPVPAEGAKNAMIDSQFILGNEKVHVFVDMDLVRFLDPSVAKEFTPSK
jgi:hypothetical protein